MSGLSTVTEYLMVTLAPAATLPVHDRVGSVNDGAGPDEAVASLLYAASSSTPVRSSEMVTPVAVAAPALLTVIV